MKIMKKNSNRKVLGLVSIVLMFTLVSACLMSGTLAKYVTESTGTDTARVAKWDINTNFTFELFKNSYATDDSNYESSIAFSVTGENGDLVIAPGTSGSYDFSITGGAPEVAYEIEIAIVAAYNDAWAATGYDPLVFTLDGAPVGNLNDLTAALSSSGTLSNYYAPLTDANAVNGIHTIGWSWPFESGDDESDTTLGELAMTQNLEITFDVAVTATQID